MCKHVPIKVYDTGGTQMFCEKCGKPLSNWKPNAGSKEHPKEKKPVHNVQQEVK